MKRRLVDRARALRPRPPERQHRPAREIALAAKARQRIERGRLG